MATQRIEKKTFMFVYLALLGLLALTIGVDFLPLGGFNTVIAIAIATAKAVLILVFFMELRIARKLTVAFAMAGFFWLIILFGHTLSDFLTRGWVGSPGW
ncbi:MAG TPA: cytochrome C oxidase subunit IV family protein [Rhodothermales bacterium]|nr:cytochrome C oxidase subunit IV family protein [Rhodothermales bacterium]